MDIFRTLCETPSPEDMSSIIRKSLLFTSASSINAVIFTLITWPSLGDGFLLLWCAFIVSMNSYIAHRNRKSTRRIVKSVSRKAIRRVVLFSILSGAPWGILPIVAFGAGSSFDRLMILMVSTGMAAGATFMLYRTLAACIAYSIVVLGPLFVVCMVSDTGDLWPLAMYTVVFGTYLVSLSANICNTARERDKSLEELSATVIQLEKAHRRISHLAFYDDVTGLPNRTTYTERLTQEVERGAETGEGLVVLMLDLDRFKDVNDTLGHEFGDRLLKLIGKRLSDGLRPEDMLARLGGDEFAIIVKSESQQSQLHDLIERIMVTLAEPVLLDGHQIYPGTSIGIACFPENGKTAEDLLLKADIALNRAKELGKGRFVMFDCTLHAKLTAEDRLAGQLRKALDDGDIRVEYQPKVDMDIGTMMGAEALVRWTHPTEGKIPPDRFLPVAASRGLLPQLTRAIFDRVCQDMLQWQKDGVAVGKIAVNIHPSDLKQPVELMDNLKRMIALGIDPKKVVLEVTEGCFVGGGTETAPLILDAINDMGFDLSLDDFGMGYASLSHLRKLPVTELKVDQSFVAGLCDNHHDRAIIAATIEIARGMGLRLIAEGVETVAQRDALLELGAVYGQGYYWAKSLSPGDLTKFVRKTAGLAGNTQTG